MKKPTKPKKFPMPDGGTKIVTDDGVFIRTETVYRIDNSDAARGAVDALKRLRDRPKPSAKEMLQRIKVDLIEAFKFGTPRRRKLSSKEELIREDASGLIRRIEVAEYFMDSGEWDRAAVEILGIGVDLARFETVDALGDLIRAKRNSDAGPKKRRGVRNPILKKFIELKEAGEMKPKGRFWRPFEALSFMKSWSAKNNPDWFKNWDKEVKAFRDAFRRNKKRAR